MQKKVGIMTLYYKTYNYGAQLQCYALQRVLTKMGYDAELIRFRWYKAELGRFYRYASLENYAKFEAFSKSIPYSKRVYTPEDIHECADIYDIFVCGSDQIWGVTKSMPSYVFPQITLSFVPDNKIKFSYAASAGGSEFEPFVRNAVGNALGRLDSISVREQSFIPAVEELSKKKPVSVLDPTMLLGAEEWDALTGSPTDGPEYIFVYNIGSNEFLESTAELFSEKLSCEMKTISYSPNDTPGPVEFIGLIKNARYVLTNSFHGTVFSILYHKDFLSFALDDIDGGLSRNVRLLDLLSLFGLPDRFVNEDSGFPLKNHIDYSLVEEVLHRERSKSFDYLTFALQSGKEGADNETDDAFTSIPHPLRDYLLAVAGSKTDNELSYEKALVERDLEIERLSCELDKEIVRNDIYCKFLKFQLFGLALDHDPLFEGKVVIYGAGKIGRLASMCFDNSMLCFADSFSKDVEHCGYPIYRLEDDGLKKLIAEHEKITFLLTPVWDFDAIEADISGLFPNAKVISAEKVVEKIWL